MTTLHMPDTGYSLLEWCDQEELHMYTGDDSALSTELVDIAEKLNMGSFEVVDNSTGQVIATGPGSIST